MSFVSKVCASLGVLAITLGITSFYLQATVFAPEQTRAAVATVMEDPAARNLVATHLAEAASAALPAEAASVLPEGALETAARTAVEDPRLVASAADAVVSAHEVVIGEPGASAPVLDAAAASAAVSDALRPFSALAADAVAAQPVNVEIPVREFPMASFLNSLTSAVAFPLTALGAVLAGIAVAVSSARARTMRRIGFSLISLTFVQTLVLWALPRFVVPQVESELAQTLGSVLSALGGQAVPYLLGTAGAGVALVAASAFLRSRSETLPPAAEPRQGATAPAESRPSAATVSA